MQPFLQGILFGLMVAITLGPAFFSLLQTSINKGFKAGVSMAIGISLSDLTLIFLSYMGISRLINNPDNQLIVGIIGGLVLAIFGLVTFTRKPGVHLPNSKELQKPGSEGLSNPFAFAVKGYFLNIANPFLIIFWMGIMSFVSTNYGMEFKTVAIFFSGTIITIFGTDLIKSFVGNRIKKYLKYSVLLWFNRIVGLILMGSAVVLISRVLFDLYIL